MHHNRHKEILKLLRQISTLDGTIVASNNLGEKIGAQAGARRGSFTTVSTTSPTDTSSESIAGEPKTTKKARKKAKKAANNKIKSKTTVEAFPREEVDFISESIHLTILESKGCWEGTYVYTNKDATPCSENTDKTEIEEFEVEDEEDIVGEVEDLGGLNVKAAYEMTPRQRKIIKKFTTPINHSSFGGGSRKYAPDSVKKSDLYLGVDPQVFVRLGVEVVIPLVNSKARKELVGRLVAAVKEDLDIIEREELETEMRKEGFIRWAGRTALHHMENTRLEIDWATGQKIIPKNQDYNIEDVGTEETVKEPTTKSTPLSVLMDEVDTRVMNSISTVSTEPAVTPTKLPVTTPTLRIIACPVKAPTNSTTRVVDGPIKLKKTIPQPTSKEMMFVTKSSPRLYGKPIVFSQLVEKHNPNEQNRWSTILPIDLQPFSTSTIRITEGKNFDHVEPNVEEENDNGWETVSRTKTRPQKPIKSTKAIVKYGK